MKFKLLLTVLRSTKSVVSENFATYHTDNQHFNRAAVIKSFENLVYLYNKTVCLKIKLVFRLILASDKCSCVARE